jgi:hypothetical protein
VYIKVLAFSPQKIAFKIVFRFVIFAFSAKDIKAMVPSKNRPAPSPNQHQNHPKWNGPI